MFYGRGDAGRIDPEVYQAGDGAGGVVGVQGGRNEVAGQGGVDGGFGRFQIVDFAHHYNVQVLS